MLLLIAPLAVAAQSACVSTPQSEVSLVSPYTVAPRMAEQRVGVHFKIAKGWHVYWRNSGSAGYPPVIDWSLTPGLQSAVASWPQPTRYPLRGGQEALGYADEVVYPFALQTRVADKLALTADVDYLVCDEESCTPHRCQLALTLPTGAPVLDTAADALLSRYEAQVPHERTMPVQLTQVGGHLSFTAEVPTHAEDDAALFFTEVKGFEVSEPQVRTRGGVTVASAMLTPNVAAHRVAHLPLDFTVTGLQGGALTTHGDYPVTAAPIPAAAKEAGALWLMLVFAFIGGLILNVMPCVLPVLSVKIIGLLEARETARRAALATTAGILTSFVALWGLVAIAHVLGAQVGWGIQFQEPHFIAFLLVVVVFFAFNLWGLFELPLPGALARVGGASHFVSGLVATLLATPCSAPFLGTALAFALTQSLVVSAAIFAAIAVGMSTPYLVLAAAPGLMRFLPRPGVWMETLKQVLGFALAATAVWLLFVLDAQIGRVAVAYVELTLLMLALVLWRGPQRVRLASALTLSLFILFLANAPESSDEWAPFDRAQAEALAEKGPVFVDVTADWCFTCKANELGVLRSDAVVKALDGTVKLRADWTNHNQAIADYLTSFGRSGIPMYVFYPGHGGAPRLLPELLSEDSVLEVLQHTK